MPSERSGPRTPAINPESVNSAFLYLLGAPLQKDKAIFVPPEVLALGNFSLKNLAIVTNMQGRPVDTAGNTRRHSLLWLPGVEIQSHFDSNHRLTQVALRSTNAENPSVLFVDKYANGRALFSRMVLDNETVLQPEPLLVAAHPAMFFRREQVTRIAEEYLNNHVNSGRFT